MAVTAGVAAGVGLASIAGGTAAAIRAQKMRTDPRGVTYGGTQDTQDSLLDEYGKGIDQGNAGYSQGVRQLGSGAYQGQQLFGVGQGIIGQANNITPMTQGFAQQAQEKLDAYVPGQVSGMQSRATIDQNSQQNLGAARASGALGLRSAINANAMAGVQAAQNAAAIRAQEQQAYVGQQVGQANQMQANAYAGQGQAQAQKLQLLGLGAQVAGGGNGQVLQAGSGLASAGLNNQGQFLGQQQNVYDEQNQNNQTYETNRMLNQQRKSNNLWGLGSSLIGGGVSALGKAAA